MTDGKLYFGLSMVICIVCRHSLLGTKSCFQIKITFLPAGNIWITNIAGRTLADGSTTIVLTDGSLSARTAGARIKYTVGVWVSGVSRSTLANGGPRKKNFVVDF